MTSDQTLETYDRFMGRYAAQLAAVLVDFTNVRPGARVLDVGCGPGALTSVLAARLGAENVSAVDPSESFLQACLDRVPGIDARIGTAELLPWPAKAFDLVVAQLVVIFLLDVDAAIADMYRVARSGGIVATCVWDYAEGMRMFRTFWDAALELDPGAPVERDVPYCTESGLADLWATHGLTQITTARLETAVEYSDFDDYWTPFAQGVSNCGAYCVSLAPEQQEALRAECFRLLGAPEGAFSLPARAFAVSGVRGGVL